MLRKLTLIVRASKCLQAFERMTNDGKVIHLMRGQVGLPRVRCVIFGIATPSSVMNLSLARNLQDVWVPYIKPEHPIRRVLRFEKG